MQCENTECPRSPSIVNRLIQFILWIAYFLVRRRNYIHYLPLHNVSVLWISRYLIFHTIKSDVFTYQLQTICKTDNCYWWLSVAWRYPTLYYCLDNVPWCICIGSKTPILYFPCLCCGSFLWWYVIVCNWKESEQYF